MPTITIQQWKTPVEIRKGTILDAALRQGVPYPHNCRVGECGGCKSRLLHGSVEHDSCFKEALSDSERSQGLILACRCKPRTDVEIAWLEATDSSPSLPLRQLKARVVGLQLATYNVSRLRLEVQGSPFAFAAGQYARLHIGRLPERSFSMANRPDEATLEFHIRHMPGGRVSGHIATELKVGDTLKLQGPFGDSYLREDHSGPIVAVAGGSGLAPVLSIVRTALENMPARPVHVYFGIQDEVDVYAEAELLQLTETYPQLRTHVVLSAPSTPTVRRTGFVHHALEQDLIDLTGAKIYTAGPPPMVKAVIDSALALGVDRTDIHSDPFTTSAAENPQSPGLLQGIVDLFATRVRLGNHSSS